MLITKYISNTKINIDNLIVETKIIKDDSFIVNINFKIKHLQLILNDCSKLIYNLSIEKIEVDLSDQKNVLKKQIRFYDIDLNGSKMMRISFNLGLFEIQNNSNQFNNDPIQVKAILFSYQYKDDYFYELRLQIASIFCAIDFEIISMVYKLLAIFQDKKAGEHPQNTSQLKLYLDLNIKSTNIISCYHDSSIKLDLTRTSSKFKFEPINFNISLMNLVELINLLNWNSDEFYFQSADYDQSNCTFDYYISFPVLNIGITYMKENKNYFLFQFQKLLCQGSISLHHHQIEFDKLDITNESKNYLNIGKFRALLIQEIYNISYESFNFIYSYELVSNISIILKAMKNLQRYDFGNNNSLIEKERKKIVFDLELTNTCFSLMEKETIKVILLMDYTHIFVNQIKTIFNIESNKMDVLDKNHESILEINDIIYNSFTNFISISNIDLQTELHFLIDTMLYFNKTLKCMNKTLNFLISSKDKSESRIAIIEEEELSNEVKSKNLEEEDGEEVIKEEESSTEVKSRNLEEEELSTEVKSRNLEEEEEEIIEEDELSTKVKSRYLEEEEEEEEGKEVIEEELSIEVKSRNAENEEEMNEKEQSKITFNINYISSTIQINKNVISFECSTNGSFIPNENSANFKLISFSIDQKVLSKPFSIHYNDNSIIFDEISFYIPLFKFDLIKSITKEIEILHKNWYKNSNVTKTSDINHFYNIETSTISVFIIKSNLPLFLLKMQPIRSRYPFKHDELFLQTNIKLELQHFSHGIYKVINRFSIIFRNNNSDFNIIVSPIYATLSSFLFEDLLSLEHSDNQIDVKYNEKILYFQNNLDTQIQLTFFNINTNKRYSINLNNNYPFLIKENEYKSDVLLNINDQEIVFSTKNIYSSIYLNQFIIASLNIENGIRTIQFSSPYLIINHLFYDIEVCINNKNIGIIEKGEEKIIPYSNNLTLNNKDIKVSPFPDNTNFDTFNLPNKSCIKLFDKKSNRNSISLIKLTYNPQKSNLSIDLLPYIKITNYLPIDLHLIILDECNLEIKSNQSLDLSFLNYINDCYFVFDFHGFAMSYKPFHFEVKKFQEKIPLYRQEKQIGTIIIKCTSEEVIRGKVYDIAIYAPVIFKNETKIPLAIKLSEKISCNFHDDFLFYCSESILNNDCLVQFPLFSPNFTTVNSTKFEFVGEFSQMINLNHKSDNQISLLLSLSKEIGNFKDSSIIKIRQYIKVIKEITQTVIFISNYQKEYKNICDCYESYISGLNINESNINGNFDIMINGYHKCHNINLLNLSTTFIRFVSIDNPNSYFIIKITVKKEENGYCCYISYPSFPSPILITNLISDKQIYVYQHYQNNFVTSPMMIDSNSTSLFAKEQPFLKEELKSKYDIIVSFGERKYPISLEKDYTSKRIYNTNYLYNVETIDKENKLVIIYEISKPYENNKNDQNNSQLSNMHCSIRFTNIEISYIDKEMHELFLLVINDVFLNIHQSIEFKINNLTLNDMYSASYSPVVLFNENLPFIDVEFKTKHKFKDFFFDDVSIKLSPLQLIFDLHFISDLIAVFMEIMDYRSKQSQNAPKTNKNNFLMNKIVAQNFIIEPIKLTISPIKSPDRKFRFKHRDYYYISDFILIKIAKVVPFEIIYQIEFDNLSSINVEAPIIDLMQSIKINCLNQIGIKKFFQRKLSLKFTNKYKFLKFDDVFTNQIGSNENEKYPIRIPRSFPKRKILNIEPLSNRTDIFSKIQFIFQRITKEKFFYEQLHELYETSQNNVISIFDNYLFYYNSNDDSQSFFIKFKEITSVRYNNLIISINFRRRIDISLKNDQDKLQLYQSIKSIIEKTRILKKYQNLK